MMFMVKILHIISTFLQSLMSFSVDLAFVGTKSLDGVLIVGAKVSQTFINSSRCHLVSSLIWLRHCVIGFIQAFKVDSEMSFFHVLIY